MRQCRIRTDYKVQESALCLNGRATAAWVQQKWPSLLRCHFSKGTVRAFNDVCLHLVLHCKPVEKREAEAYLKATTPVRGSRRTLSASPRHQQATDAP
jgi:hypothetical protein